MLWVQHPALQIYMSGKNIISNHYSVLGGVFYLPEILSLTIENAEFY